MNHSFWSFVPVLSIVCSGVMVVTTLGTMMRKKAAREVVERMKNKKITKDFIKKILHHRRMYQSTFKKIKEVSKDSTQAPPVSPVQGQATPTEGAATPNAASPAPL